MLAHLYAHEYVNLGYIDEDSFTEFYKFSVVRDPIDRIVSELNYRNMQQGCFGVNSAEEYIVKSRNKFGIDSDIVRHLEPQVNFLFDENMENFILDKVIKFDEIELEFNRLKSQIGFNSLELKKENVSKSKKWLKSELPQSDVVFLKEFYQDDYKFLASLD